MANTTSYRTGSSATTAKKAKLRLSTLKAVFIPLWLLSLHVVAVLLFAKGFLLSRPVLPDIADTFSNDPAVVLPKPFKRAVIVLIDALREDFITGNCVKDSGYFCDAFVTPVKLAVAKPENAAVFKFIADPPTTTLQRLKALTTGSLPTFIDAGSNFNGMELLEDSWITQLTRIRGENRIAFAGDDTWLSLFPQLNNGTKTKLTFPYESFNVWDMDTVDAGVTSHIFPLLQRKDEWDVMIAHYLGVDHAGHRFGPDTPQMRAKLIQMDKMVEDLIKAIEHDDDTLLVVLGDHGMDLKGDHGGDSQGEVEAGLFLYSSRQFLSPSDEIGTVNQIDFVPTLSVLLDLPVPFNNLGSPIIPAMLGPNGNFQQLASAARLVSNQIFQYRGSHPSFAKSAEITTLYEEATSPLQTLNYEEISELNLLFQKKNLQESREMWARFDIPSMVMGIIVLVLSVITSSAFYFYYDGLECSIADHIDSLIMYCLIYAVIGLTIGSGIGYVLNRTAASALFTSAICSMIGCLARVYSFWSQSELAKPNISYWTLLGLGLTVSHGFVFASNSYVVWESRTLSFLLVSVGIALLASSFKIADLKFRTAAGLNAITFIIQARLADYPKICREEQLAFCTSNFYASTASSVSSIAAIILLYAVALFFPAIVKSFLRTSASYEGAAPLWIGKGLRFALILVALHWTLDYAENKGIVAHESMEQIHLFKIAIARLLVGVGIIGAPIAWYRAGPLCLRVEMSNNQELIKNAMKEGDMATANKLSPVSVEIIGFANTYGSLFLLLFLSIFTAVMLCMKPVGGIAMAGMVYQLLSLLEVGDYLNLPTVSPLITPIVLCVMASQYYFATGHQATLPSIQWDVAFLLTEGIRAPFTHLALILNTFGPYLSAGLAVPLTVLYKLAPSPREYRESEIVMTRVIRAAAGAMIYMGGLTALNFVMTLILRRHLMVWKIFAPRFMLAGASLLAVDVAILLGTLASAKVITNIYDVFG
ncbi:hypothetical protein V1512DRAFT_226081 [Lipomyces arxii]|uniref:uncharacterized protein n=1 Tax=Lipomyces arxii TaxID=56418 RepID=UPI0034CE9A17